MSDYEFRCGDCKKVNGIHSSGNVPEYGDEVECIKCGRFSDIYVDDGSIFKGKNMSFGLYQKIIDDIGDILISIRLWHFGEPLLNNDIFRMVKYAKRKNIIVAISSNLSLLSKDTAKILVESGLDYLIVSFDGASPQTYHLYHGRDDFERVLNNIRILVKTKKKLKSLLPFIELQFIVMKENEKEIDKIKNLANELRVDKLTYLKLDTTIINLARKGFNSNDDILPKNKNYCLNKEEIMRINFCRIPWETTVIRYSGLIAPCVTDRGQVYKMGRLFQNNEYVGFRKLWNNNNYCSFRRRIARNINSIEICSDCLYRNHNVKDQI